MPYIADRRLYLNREGDVVEEGDESAATLLAAEGQEIPDERAAELGLTGEKPAKEPVVVPSTAADDTEGSGSGEAAAPTAEGPAEGEEAAPPPEPAPSGRRR